MSKWSEFVYSFSTTTQPIIEQLLDDSSLSITDFDALKALNTSQLVTKLEAVSIANPSFINALATCLYNAHADLGSISDYTTALPSESDNKWSEFNNKLGELWSGVTEGFQNDVESLLLNSFTEYTNLFDVELHSITNALSTDAQLAYASFAAFQSDDLATLQSKITGLNSSSDVIIQLANLMTTKAIGAVDWTQFTTNSFPTDTNLSAILNSLEQDMTLASITYSTFSGYDAGEMADSIVTNATNFLNNFAQYLYFYRDCTWNIFKGSLTTEIETHINAFTTSSECFIAFGDMVLPQAQNFEISVTGDYTVKGVIVDLSGKPLVGKRVKVFDKNYKDLTQVGNTFTTNFDGEYGIGFDKADLGDPDKDAPDLEIEVFDTDGTTSLRKAPCVLNAMEETIMNLVVGSGVYTGRVEYEVLHRKLSRVIGDGDVSTDTDCDILNLAYRFNFSYENVNLYIKSRVYSQNFTDIDSEVFYGLMRGGRYTDFKEMLLQPASTLVSALERASTSNFVDRSFLDEAPGATSLTLTTMASYFISNLIAQIPTVILANSVGATRPLNIHISNVEYITSTTLNSTQKQEILSILMDSEQHIKDGSIYWDNLTTESSLNNAQIDALKYSAVLASALRGKRQFAKLLIQTDDITNINGILDLDTSQWQDKIDSHSITIPDALNDSDLTAAENRDNYVVAIQKYLESLFPSQYAIARFDEQSTITKTDFQTFFSNNDAFDLGKSNVSKYLDDNPSALTGISDPTGFTDDLNKFVRLFRLSPSFKRMDVIVALWGQGIFSASKILLLGQAAFTELMSTETGLSDEQINITFRKASKRASEALHIYANFTPQYTNVLPSVISENLITIDPSTELPPEYSDLEDLLTSGDYCSCAHCQSVFSPAAYLHDILIWLDGIKGTASQSLLEVLLGRRTELDQIYLDCENTNTVIPYIDLIIELLEYEINIDQSSPDWGKYSSESNFLSRQTTHKSEQLRAFPEHVLPSVYTDIISKSAYPWKTGGFDLWTTQWGTFLSYLNISPYDLAKKIEKSDNGFLSDELQDLRYLNINPLESALIRYNSSEFNTITGNTLGLHVLYGYETTGAMATGMFDEASPAPVVVSTFLDRTGLEFDELKEYLSAKFINPGGELVTLALNSCDLDEATLDLTAGELQKFYQFFRLHQKFGGTIAELDYALKGNALSSNADLSNVIQIKKYAEKLDVSVFEASIWFNGFSLHQYDDEQSQYELIFLDELTISNYSEVFPKFKLNEAGTELDDTTGIDNFNDSVVSAHIKKVLNLNDSDYASLVSKVGTTRSITKMAELYSYVGMAGALKITIDEIILLDSLFEYTPFQNVDTFLQRGLEIKESEFKAREVDFLLRDNEHLALNIGITSEQAIDALSILRSELTEKLGDFLLSDSNNRKLEVLSMIDRLREASISPWNNEDHINQFKARIERINSVGDAQDYTDFKADLDSLNFNVSTELDPLEDQLFNSGDGAYLAPSTSMEARYGLISDLLKGKLVELLWPDYSASGKQVVVKNIASWLSIEEYQTEYLLSNHLDFLDNCLDYENFVSKTDTITSGGSYDTLIDDMKNLYRFSTWLANVNVSTDHLEILFDASYSPFDLSKVLEGISSYSVSEFDSFIELGKLIHVNEVYRRKSTDLINILEMSDGTSKQEAVIATTGWDSELVEGIGSSTITSTELIQMSQAAELLKSGNLSYAQAKAWNSEGLSQDQADSVTQGVRQKLESTSKGLERVAQLRDHIRLAQRDALLNHLIAFRVNSGSPVFADSNDVYDYLLADPEMNPCMPSSRIKFASLSAQLFVNRILMGIEPSPAVPTDSLVMRKDDREEWEWRKNYRVWEANRKVFTYPENWMEPELRDDQTELFKIMTDKLQQVDATDENVSDIFTEYLESLDGISKMEIAQMYRDDEAGIIHVFATIPGTSPEYYYRQLIGKDYWTEWKRVNLQIESSQLIPVVWNERLVLMWPTFEEKADIPENPKEGEASNNKLYFRLNWSVLKGDKWSAPIRSTNSIIADVKFKDADRIFFSAKFTNSTKTILKVESYCMRNDKDNDGNFTLRRTRYDSFSFAGGIGSDPVVLKEYNANAKEAAARIERFQFGGKAAKQKFWNDWAYVDQTSVLDMSYNYNNQGDIVVVDVDILKKIKQPSWLTIPHQFVSVSSFELPKRGGTPMFFEDDQHVYFVRQKRKIESLLEGSAREVKLSASEDLPDSPVMKWEMTSGTSGGNIIATSQNSSGGGSVPNNGNDSSASMSIDANTQTLLWSDGNPSTHHNGEQYLINVTKGKTGTVNNPVYEAEQLPYAPSNFVFSNFYHPYTALMLRQVRRLGISGLLDPNFKNDTDSKLLYRQTVSNDYFEDTYLPTYYVETPYPIASIDFSYGSSYGTYNWEIFFHAPMAIATRLMQNQRFEEAKKWIEYIFDPTETDNYDLSNPSSPTLNHDTPDRFWKLKPFRELSDNSAANRLISYIEGEGDLTDDQIEVWRNNPFSPYAVGRVRTLSFMKKTVMLYLDNLIAWGDHLFARDTMESINEAAMLYILAARILGKRPRKVTKDGTATNINGLLSSDNGLGDLILFENTLSEKEDDETDERTGASLSTINLPNFCIPQNEKMTAYWDIIIDRLFKVRNCMNISGLVRKLPLFEPEIDPAILVKAFASGLGVSGALAEIYDRPSPYRFAYLYQKAVEYANDVKSLGGSILSAIEKRDAEELSVLRSEHELNLLNRQLELKQKSIEDAKISIESLEINKEITNDRYIFHKDRIRRSKGELEQLTKLQISLIFSQIGQSLSSVSGLLAAIPEFSTGTAGLGPVVEAEVGGRSLSAVMSIAASIMNQISSQQSQQAGIVGIRAGYERRDEEWGFQEKTAMKELTNLDKQMESAKIKLILAEKEVDIHKLQIEQSAEVNAFMKDKFSNKELYSWMLGRLSKLYFEAYNLAYKMAKKAEKAYYHELGIEQGTSGFINFNNWDNLKRGLLAGEGLYNDLKRLDTAYTENNVREYELTKQFSLATLNADQLIQLREKGTCDFSISEMMYDLDHPGHYYRRIKSVSLTIPCVAGPFTNISAKLTLLNHRIRTSSSLGDNDYNSITFQEGTGIQSIATSTGQNDSGVFELNFNDSRYLPFEYAGAISSWRLELPNIENTQASEVLKQFDYDTISDVILTVRYMARDGGSTLKNAALQNIESNVSKALDYLATNEGLYRVVSMKSEFPTELHQFLNPVGSADHSATFDIGAKHFPFPLRSVSTEFLDLAVLVKLKDGYSLSTVPTSPAGLITVALDSVNYNSTLTTTIADPDYAGLCSTVFGNKSTSPIASWKLDALASAWDISGSTDPKDAVEDILLVIKYKKA